METIDQEPVASTREGLESAWDIFKLHTSNLEGEQDNLPPSSHIPTLDIPAPTSTAARPSRETTTMFNPETVFLLQTYLRSVAIWMDLFDFDQHYQLHVSRMTLTSPLIFHCICAFTAQYLSLAKSCCHKSLWGPVARSHYVESLRLMNEELNRPHPHLMVTAGIIVSSYEVLATLSSDPHWRHFLGLAMLVKHCDIPARSTGIDRANFLDLCAA